MFLNHKFSKIISLIVFLLIVITSIKCIYPSSTYASNYSFSEEFNGDFSHEDKWNIYPNGGQVDFSSGHSIKLDSSIPYRFSYIENNQNVFPEGNFSIEWKFKYLNSNYNHGAGIAITDVLPENGTTVHPNAQTTIFSSWVATGGRIAINFAVCEESNPQCSSSPPPFISDESDFYNSNTIRINYLDHKYYVYYNEGLIFVSAPSMRIPKYIWFGNPMRLSNPGIIWPPFQIDYIHISSIQKSPIILIPGHGASWNLPAMLTGTAVGPWTKTPFVKTYDNLKATLTSPEAGYVQNNTYFEFFYDWRKRINSLADDLNDYINNTVLANNPNAKVKIVAHSMGGLVTRAYVNKYGDTKIEKAVTLGSPHKGVLKSYYAWEGGLVADEFSWDSVALELLLMIHRKGFQTPKDVVHHFSPSTQDLLPIFDYLKNFDGSIKSIDSMTYQNDFLKNLADTNAFKQKLVTIYGRENNPEKNTVEYYLIKERTILHKLLGLWSNGYPFAKEYTLDGDLRVLQKSAAMSDVLAAPEVIGDHVNIMESRQGIETILDSFGITGVIPVTSIPSPSRSPSLVILLHSPANIKVSGPDGEVGHGVTTPLERAIYSPDDKLIVIPNAQKGDYKIEITGTDTGAYNLEIGQLTENKDEWQTISGQTNLNQTRELEIEFDPEEPQENPLKDETGQTFLALSKEQLENLSDYFDNNVSSKPTKNKLQFFIKKIIKNLDRAEVYLNKEDYFISSRFTLTGLLGCYQLRKDIDKYNQKGLVDEAVQTYGKNELDSIGQFLLKGWLNLYSQGNQTIKLSRALRYKNTAQKALDKVEQDIQVKADEENKTLGSSLDLTSQACQKAEDYLNNQEYSLSYVNSLICRLLSLETKQLIK